MSEISDEDLKKEIEKILKKTPNQGSISRKTIRMALEKKFGVDLLDKKTVIGELVTECVKKIEEESEEEEEEEEEKKATSPSEASESEEEVKEKKKKPKKRAAATRKRKSAGSDEDSDSDWDKKKAKGKKGKSGGGYTRACKLSPALAELVGAKSLPRYEVVKQVWSIIKKNNLYDPNNKQFALCDDALYSVIGTKRFKIFGMMKYLKNHFVD